MDGTLGSQDGRPRSRARILWCIEREIRPRIPALRAEID